MKKMCFCFVSMGCAVVASAESVVEKTSWQLKGVWAQKELDIKIHQKDEWLILDNFLPEMNVLYSAQKEVFYIDATWQEQGVFRISVINDLPKFQMGRFKAVSDKNKDKIRYSHFVNRKNCGLLETRAPKKNEEVLLGLRQVNQILFLREFLTKPIEGPLGDCSLFEVKEVVSELVGEPMSYYSGKNQYNFSKTYKGDLYDEFEVNMIQGDKSLSAKDLEVIRLYYQSDKIKKFFKQEVVQQLTEQEKSRSLKVLQAIEQEE